MKPPSRPTDEDMPPFSEAREPSARRPHLWLLLLPFLWQVAAVPWANGVTLRIWSLPFLLVWQMAGVLFATAVIAIVYRIDHRGDARTGE
jgi:hypothetical protein